jgi:hypothetical protein
MSGDEPSFGDELSEGVGDAVAPDPELLGEGTRRREPRPGLQPTGSDRIPKLLLDARTHTAIGQIDVEIDPESGPRTCH